jgi:hypothetical protein
MYVQVSLPKCRKKLQPEESQYNILQYGKGQIIRYDTNKPKLH